MNYSRLLSLLIVSSGSTTLFGYEQDQFDIDGKNLKITFFGHASLMLEYDSLVIHVDPFGKMADYSKMPKADIILVTHEHFDHLDPESVDRIRKDSTVIIASAKPAASLKGAQVMKNGDEKQLGVVKIKAVPAYNLTPERLQFHARGGGNGYVLSIGGKNIYIAGDTENVPEMKDLKNIDIAFLPMNLPYTMTPEQVADAVKTIRPSVFYPYHFRDTDPQKVVDLLKAEKGIEVRVRKLA